ncbi:MAG TPA: peptidoglycan-binding protein [Acidimicrobiales bacterium]|nr:peptidoglycan-binding protein [Acidimicrobiales bacterium]
MRGRSGPAVEDLQRRLGALGHRADDRPGHYGPGTEQAVCGFQAARGLRVDGVCGRQTWSALIEAGWALGDRLLYRRTPMLRGDDVADLQRRLGGLGFDTGRVDGIFGDDTGRGLSEFQRNAGLTVDAICGPATIAALQRLEAARTSNEPVSQVRERLRSWPDLAGRRVVVAQPGGLDVLVTAVLQELARASVEAVAVVDPDGSAQAAAANGAGAEAFVAFEVTPEREGVSAYYYAGFRYESPAGERLAHLLVDAVTAHTGLASAGVKGMSLPALRETRMPAVICEVGPVHAVVEHSSRFGPALRQALAAWVAGGAGSSGGSCRA